MVGKPHQATYNFNGLRNKMVNVELFSQEEENCAVRLAILEVLPYFNRKNCETAFTSFKPLNLGNPNY